MKLQYVTILTYDINIIDKLLPAKVNQIMTHLPGHCDGPACSQSARGSARCLCYL